MSKKQNPNEIRVGIDPTDPYHRAGIYNNRNNAPLMVFAEDTAIVAGWVDPASPYGETHIKSVQSPEIAAAMRSAMNRASVNGYSDAEKLAFDKVRQDISNAIYHVTPERFDTAETQRIVHRLDLIAPKSR